jgi:hypothetical protein
MHANQIAAIGLPEVGLLIFAGIAIIPLFYFVHGLLNWICFAHVKRYCRIHEIDVSGWRLFPAFDERGIKTENTQIEILSNGPEDEQTIYRFIVWAFGIRNVVESPFNPDEEKK